MENPNALREGDLIVLTEMLTIRGVTFYRGHQFRVRRNAPLDERVRLEPLRFNEFGSAWVWYHDIESNFKLV